MFCYKKSKELFLGVKLLTSRTKKYIIRKKKNEGESDMIKNSSIKKENNDTNIYEIAETLAAVHTHTHTHGVLSFRK